MQLSARELSKLTTLGKTKIAELKQEGWSDEKILTTYKKEAPVKEVSESQPEKMAQPSQEPAEDGKIYKNGVYGQENEDGLRYGKDYVITDDGKKVVFDKISDEMKAKMLKAKGMGWLVEDLTK